MSAAPFRLKELLRAKRDGGVLKEDDARWFLKQVALGEVGEAEQAALLSSIFFHGMEPAELEGWTRGMVASGDVLDLSGFEAPRVDKHSTGGVGDKVSLPLAPALAAAGCVVPMISGRGLGHTGGTLDKLEAVPGVRTDLDESEIRGVLEAAGCVICAQTEAIAPADRALYALRDRVELVESLPLISSSIISKKVAEDIDALVLDVKVGTGSFLVEEEEARAVAQTMVNLATAAGVHTSARLTRMGQPLGLSIGHTLEIEESIAVLEGGGPADLVDLVTLFGGDLLAAAGVTADEEAGRDRISGVLQDGSALDRFERMLTAQGAADALAPLEQAPDLADWIAPRDGFLTFADLRDVGLAVAALGGGRTNAGDQIDHAVGIVSHKFRGERVRAGEAIATIHHRAGVGLEECLRLLGRGVTLEPDVPSPQPLVLERVLPRPTTSP